jgi:TRAP-type C4-dicarboxylate transport system permease large subunit
MSDPALGLTMLGLIVMVIMMGFPTAFTLMGLGMFFGYIAFYVPGQPIADNRIFFLMVERTYGAMTNETLLSIPLFVLMGYVMERGALVDKMFYSIQLAFRRVPASLAVATLIVCTFWGIASGLVGAVVVLMGVIAFNPMLKAGYDVRLASGVITAGGTLGILIPPSVMIIVYAAVAGQSVVKLYASAMFPGFFLSFLYLVYIIGWALWNPKIAPELPEAEQKVPVSDWVRQFEKAYSPNIFAGLVRSLFSPARALAITSEGTRITYGMLWKNFIAALFPLILCAVTLWGVWWYVVIHQQASNQQPEVVTLKQSAAPSAAAAPADEKPQEMGMNEAVESTSAAKEPEGVEEVGDPELLKQGPKALADEGTPPEFFYWFWAIVAATAALVILYYWIMGAEQFELLKLLTSSVMPLASSPSWCWRSSCSASPRRRSRRQSVPRGRSFLRSTRERWTGSAPSNRCS